jgi:hypothetical protein
MNLLRFHVVTKIISVIVLISVLFMFLPLSSTANADSTVTLTLYVHQDSSSGPVISGAQVSGYDGNGNSFNTSTGSSGYVNITGVPGSWSFTASKFGYRTENWTQSITSNCERHAYLMSEAPQQVTLTININGQGSTGPVKGMHKYDTGSKITITASPASGWVFDSWGGDIYGSNESITINMSADKTITAYFKEVSDEKYSLSIKVSPSGAGAVIPGKGTYEAGTNVTLNASPASGWKFVRWEGGVSGNSNRTTVTMNSNKNITAYFEQVKSDKYTLSIIVEGQGMTDPAPGTYTCEKGEKLTITALPADDWEFSHWGGDLSGNSQSITININKNMNVIAYFEKVSYKVSYKECWSTDILSDHDLAYLVKRYFPDDIIPKTGESIRVVAFATARAESNGNPTACNVTNKEQSYGLWQINVNAHPQYDKDFLLEPENNAKAAAYISNDGCNWKPWTQYCNGEYKNYIDNAKVALESDTGKFQSKDTNQEIEQDTSNQYTDIPSSQSPHPIMDNIRNILDQIITFFHFR